MEPRESEIQDKPQLWSGLGVRVVSSVVLGAIALICAWLGGMIFDSFIILAALIMKKEWDALIGEQSILLRATGYVYIILPCASLLWLRALPNNAGLAATLVLIALVSATDIGAYFVGRKFGKHKLAPVISPNKTWEGLLGGAVAAMLTAVFLSSYAPAPHDFASALWIGPFIAVLAQASDLFESFVKRQAGVKDSGTLLPGHGGLLDRFDGYIFTIPVFAFLTHYALTHYYAPPAIQ